MALGGSVLVTPLEMTSVLHRFSALLYLLVVIAATLLGRLVAGVVAVIASALLLDYYVVSPVNSLNPDRWEDVVALLVFGAIALLVAEILAHLERSRMGAQSARAQAELAIGRLSLVSQVSELMAHSMEYPAPFERLARLVVGSLADYCLIDILVDGNTIERVAAVAADPEKQLMTDRLRTEYAPQLDGTHPVARVIRTGGPEFMSEMSEEFLRETSRGEEHFRIVRELGFRSFMCLPLVARGHILGTMTLVSAAARYISAAQGSDVGGDFYDVFALHPDLWMACIGDVCGKGAPAASVTGLARYTLRALALSQEDPIDLLSGLNRAMLGQRDTQTFCTVCCARIEVTRDEATVTLSAGGHPRPVVLRADGTVELVGAYGTLLGVFPEITLSEAKRSLAPGDSIVFYTDGLEASGGDAEEQAKKILSGRRESSASQLADFLARAAEQQEGRRRDDLAILVLRKS